MFIIYLFIYIYIYICIYIYIYIYIYILQKFEKKKSVLDPSKKINI